MFSKDEASEKSEETKGKKEKIFQGATRKNSLSYHAHEEFDE